MTLGITTETHPGERRVALVPTDVAKLKKKNLPVIVQSGAGIRAGYLDTAYEESGATLVKARNDVFAQATWIAQVRGPGANSGPADDDVAKLDRRHALIAFTDPLGQPLAAQKLAKSGCQAFALELVPRITRAQNMDALSSMANLAGYRAALIAATHLPKIFPMMMTAAGTLSPARILVLGAGVAGLQAIATAKRLGAIVSAYDVRPEVAEQVKSVGGTFITLDVAVEQASDNSGYAKAQSEAFYKKQQAALAQHVAVADVVITTAAIPGRRAPILLPTSMVDGMKPGSLIVDLAAETGGNCELTQPGQHVEHKGVLILGPVNMASDHAHHASQLFSRNVITLLDHLRGASGAPDPEHDAEIFSATRVCAGGDIVHPRVAEVLKAAG